MKGLHLRDLMSKVDIVDDDSSRTWVLDHLVQLRKPAAVKGAGYRVMVGAEKVKLT